MRTQNVSAAVFVLTAAATGVFGADDPSAEFSTSIRPVLAENCGACHNGARARGPANFLRAQTAKDIESDRGLWRNVAAQLRNRTMPPVASKLAESMAHPALSERELQVLQYMANGRINKEIGQILYISESTVKTHVRSILTKLEAMGRTEAIAVATRRGLIRGSLD